MSRDWELIGLQELGVMRIRGTDAHSFLQGQLSGDMRALTAHNSVLSGYHNPQGRTVAVLRLAQLQPDDLLAVIPRELAAAVTARLAKFILRSRVRIADESSQWRVSGLIAPDPVAGDTPAVGETGVLIQIERSPPRWLLVHPAELEPSEALPLPMAAVPGTRQQWRCLDLAAGLPQIYAQTSEHFVAQMLNLDVLGAIAFDKGCYTGQEVIARAHYRGRVKRRMQHFISQDACQLAPGDSGQLTDGRSYAVVEAVQLENGCCEFLAVAPLATGAAAQAEFAPDPALPGLRVQSVALPYPLPE